MTQNTEFELRVYRNMFTMVNAGISFMPRKCYVVDKGLLPELLSGRLHAGAGPKAAIAALRVRSRARSELCSSRDINCFPLAAGTEKQAAYPFPELVGRDCLSSLLWGLPPSGPKFMQGFGFLSLAYQAQDLLSVLRALGAILSHAEPC